MDPAAAVRCALSQQEPLGRRLAKLKALKQHALQAAAGPCAPFWLPSCTQQLLPLLLDSHPELRSTAAQVAAVLGSQLANSTVPPAQTAPGRYQDNTANRMVFFDWGSAVLRDTQPHGSPVVLPLLPHQQETVLSALSQGLMLLPSHNMPARQHAIRALLSGCLHLLEAATTTAALLAPTLAALSTVIKADAQIAGMSRQGTGRARGAALQPAGGSATPALTSVGAAFSDIIDLLLGWSLEPGLPEADRSKIYSIFSALKPYWGAHSSFALKLATNLSADLLTSTEAAVSAAVHLTSRQQLEEHCTSSQLSTASAAAAAAIQGLGAPGPNIAGQPVHRGTPDINMPEILRLAGALSALLQAAASTPAAAQLLALYPSLLTSYARLLCYTNSHQAQARDHLHQLNSVPPSLTGQGRRAQAAAKLAAEQVVAAATAQHADLVGVISAMLQQFTPTFRDAVMEGAIGRVVPAALRAALQQPCCPSQQQLQQAAASHSSAAAGAQQDKADDVLAEVRKLIADIFARVVQSSTQQNQPSLPEPVMTGCATTVAVGPDGTADPEAVLVWLASAGMELLLQALHSPATQPSSIPQLLTTCAVLLVITVAADDQAAMQLACDPRLLPAAAHTAPSLGATTPEPVSTSGPHTSVDHMGAQVPGHSQEDGVWGLRHAADLSVRDAVLVLLCDILNMSGDLGNHVLSRLLQELDSLAKAEVSAAERSAGAPLHMPDTDMAESAALMALGQQPTEQVVLFNLSVLQAAITKDVLSSEQLPKVGSVLTQTLLGQANQQKMTRSDATTASAAMPACSLSKAIIIDTFNTWAQCSLAQYCGALNAAAGAAGTAAPHCASASLDSITSAFDLVSDLVSAYTQDKEVCVVLCTWPVSLLQRLLKASPVSQIVLTTMHSPDVRDALLALLRQLAGLQAVEARLNCIQAVSLSAQLQRQTLQAVHSISEGNNGIAEAAATSPTPALHTASMGTPATQFSSPLELSLGLLGVALQLLGDTDSQVTSQALPVCLSLSAAPVSAISTLLQQPAGSQFAHGTTSIQGMLTPPSWHDDGVLQAQACTWRPAHLARLFSLLFPETVLAASLSPGEGAPGGVLLRKRPEPAPATSATAAAAAPPAALVPAVIGSLPTAMLRRCLALQPASAEAGQSGGDAPDVMVGPSAWLEVAAMLSPEEGTPDTATGSAAAVPQQAPTTGTDQPVKKAPAKEPVTPNAQHQGAPSAWRVVQDAAKACVASRLRTHLGGPSQSLAALERLLHGLHAHLKQNIHKVGHAQPSITEASPPNDRLAPKALHESAWLALEFVGGLERAVTAACHGGPGGDTYAWPVLAFFSANKRVCDDWFVRTRDVLLNIASLTSSHHAVVYHGWQHLEDLHAHLTTWQSQQQQGKQDAADTPAGGSKSKPDATAAGKPVSTDKAGSTPGSQQQQQQQKGTPTLLQAKKAPLGASSGKAKAGKEGAAGTPGQTGKPGSGAGTSQAQPAAAGGGVIPTALAKDVIETIQAVGDALLALGAWDSLQGLHHWASQAFSSLFSAHGSGTTSASAEGSMHTHEDPLLWLVGFGQMAQGRYEQALHYLTTWLRQQHMRQGQVAAASITSNSSPLYAAAITQLSAVQPSVAAHLASCYGAVMDWSHFHSFVTSQHKRAQTDASTAAWWSASLQTPHMQDLCAWASFDVNGPLNPELKAFNMSPVQGAVMAGLQALATAPKPTQTTAGQGGSAVVQGSAQQGARAPSTSTSTTSTEQSEACMHQFCRRQAVAVDDASEVLRRSCWQGLHFGQLQPWLAACLLTRIQHQVNTLFSASSTQADGGPVVLPVTHPLQLLLPLESKQAGTHPYDSARDPVQDMQAFWQPKLISPAVLMLPHKGHYMQAAAAPTNMALPALSCLLRVQQTIDQQGATALNQQLLLVAAAAARSTGNTGFFSRLCDRLAALPTIHSNSHLSAGIAVAHAHVLAEAGAMSVTEVVERQLLALQPLLLQPKQLLATPTHGATHGSKVPSLSVAAQPFTPGGPYPSPSSTAAHTSVPHIFGHPQHEIASHSLAASFLSFAHWAGRCGQSRLTTVVHAAAARAAGSKGASVGPMAMVDWVGLLKMLASTPLNAPHSKSAMASVRPASAQTGAMRAGQMRHWAYTPTGQASSGAVTAMITGTDAMNESLLVVPEWLLKQHTVEAAAHVAALHLSGHCPSAWLQWGMSLLTWQREARQQQITPAGSTAVPQQAPQTSTHATAVQPQQQQQQQQVQGAAARHDEQQLALAGMHALCMWLQSAWSQNEVVCPEDTMPALLRVLQVVVRYGHVLEEPLQQCLAAAPPAAWQALTPQLFAQLRHQQPGVRRLVCGLLAQAASAAPFAVLYPALAELQAGERAESTPQPELQALLQGLDAAHPRLLDDVRILMAEAERLTVTWEERWHALLSELEVDVSRRCVSIRAEAERLEASWAASSASLPALRSGSKGGSSGGGHGDSTVPSHVAADGSFMVGSMTVTAAEEAMQQAKQPLQAAKALTIATPGQGPKAVTTGPPGPAPKALATSTIPQGRRGKASGKGAKQPPAGPAAPAMQVASAKAPAAAAAAAATAAMASMPQPPVPQFGAPIDLGATAASARSNTNQFAAHASKPPSAAAANAWALPLPFMSGRSSKPGSKPEPEKAAPTGWGASGIQDIPADMPPTSEAPGTTGTKGTLQLSESVAQPAEPQEADEAERAAAAAEAAEVAAAQKRAILHTRYTALMSPVVLVLERTLRACAACAPETPSEQRFADEVLPSLAAAISAFKTPSAATIAQLGTQPQACWEPIKAVIRQLDVLLRQPSLQLLDVSPALASLINSEVPIPGLSSSHTLPSYSHKSTTGHQRGHGRGIDDGENGQSSTPATASFVTSLATGSGVTIAGVHPVLRVLPTKTRPKRLVFLGSDGRQHVFLLKGKDDLRMDERLMQILRVANSLLASDAQASQLGIAARHYSVTPLGERVGLIQWVGHTTSLFSLFKGWQSSMRQRHAAMQAARQEAVAAVAAAAGGAAGPAGPTATSSADASSANRGGAQQRGSTGPSPAAVPPATGSVLPSLPPPSAMVTTSRPAELFYSQLLPELRAAGLTGMVPRTQWPIPVLKRVLNALAQQAPTQVVAQQLRGSSGSAISWWSRQRSYAASLAISSMMGYLTGLGDRHLDNILLDTVTGEVVHIDFNVCFERGFKLRVPELVPFRLTQALSAGLGAAGGAHGGAYRTTCEVVLHALQAQSRREALVSLLDVVLGDPLVGWSESSEREAAARRDLELVVTLSLFASRMEEAREPLTTQLEALRTLVEGPGAALVSYLHLHASLAALKATAQKAAEQQTQAKATIVGATADQGPASEALQSAITTHKGLQAEARGLQDAGAQLIRECQDWMAQHNQVLAAVRDDTVPELVASPSIWCCAQSDIPLTLLLPLAGDVGLDQGFSAPSHNAGILTAAQTAGVLPMDFMHACTSVDQQGLPLLQQLDSLLRNASRALSAYGAVLRLLLPADYPHSSHHHSWGAALSEALAATSPQAMEQARSQVPQLPSRQAALRVWNALHGALYSMDEPLQFLAYAASQGDQQGTDSMQVLEAQTVDMLASFAAADSLQDLAPLSEGLQSVLQLACQQAAAQLHEAGLQRTASTLTTMLAAPADAPMTGMDSNLLALTVPPLLPQQSPASAAIQSTASLLYSTAHWVQLLDRFGLSTRLLPSSTTSPPTAGIGHTGPSFVTSTAQSLLQGAATAAHAAAACELVSGSRGALADLIAWVQAGETTLLQEALMAVEAAEQQLASLVQQGSALQQALQQHQHTVQHYHQEVEALQDKMLALPSSSTDETVAKEHDTLQQQLQQLHAAWQHRDSILRQLQQQAYNLHAAAAQTTQGFYSSVLGPCALLEPLVGSDAAQYHAHLQYSWERLVSGADTTRVAVLQGHEAGLAALLGSSFTDLFSAKGCTEGSAQVLRMLGQQLLSLLPPTGSSNIPWGSIQVHNIMAAPALLMLHVAKVSMYASCLQRQQAQDSLQPVVDAGAHGNGSGSMLPLVLQCWWPHLQAVQGLHTLLQTCIEAAQDAQGSKPQRALQTTASAASLERTHRAATAEGSTTSLTPAVMSQASSTASRRSSVGVDGRSDAEDGSTEPVSVRITTALQQQLAQLVAEPVARAVTSLQHLASTLAQRALVSTSVLQREASLQPSVAPSPAEHKGDGISQEPDLPTLQAFTGFDLSVPGEGIELEELGGVLEDPEDQLGELASASQDMDSGLGDSESLTSMAASNAANAAAMQNGDGAGIAASNVPMENGRLGVSIPMAGEAANDALATAMELPTPQDVRQVLHGFMQGQAEHIRRALWSFQCRLQQSDAGQLPVLEPNLAAAAACTAQYTQQLQAQRLHHLAAMAWLQEHVLLQEDGLLPGEHAPGDVLHAFFSQVSWNPLEPGAQMQLTSRQELVVKLQALCDGLAPLTAQLQAWEQASSTQAGISIQALQRMHRQQQGVGRLADMLQAQLARRRQWLAGSGTFASQLSQTCAAVVQLEVSRQGAAWAPGSPLVVDAFASCGQLLSRVEAVYAALGEQHARVVAAQESCRQLQQQVHTAGMQLQAAQVQQEAAHSQMQGRLPQLVLAESKLVPALEALHGGLPAATLLLTKELGPLLNELHSLAGKQQAARDVAALAASTVGQHAGLAQAVDILITNIPVLQQCRATVAAQHGLPVAVIHEIQAGRLPADPLILPRVAARGAALLSELQPAVEQLLPCIKPLHEMPSLIPRLTTSLDSLTAAANSVAAAIQSEHALDLEPEPAGSIGGPSTGSTEQVAGTTAATGPATASTVTKVTDAVALPLEAGSLSGTLGAGGSGNMPSSSQAQNLLPGSQLDSSGPVSRSTTPPPAPSGSAGQLQAAAAAAEETVAGLSPPMQNLTTGLGVAKLRASAHSSQAARARARRVWMGQGLHAVGGTSRTAQHATAAQQQEAKRRAYAVNALRRCIQKLEGKDTWDVAALAGSSGSSANQPATSSSGSAAAAVPAADASSSSTAAGAGVAAQKVAGQTAPLNASQQVAMLIQQATSPDNLCRMFEGWMPWL